MLECDRWLFLTLSSAVVSFATSLSADGAELQVMEEVGDVMGGASVDSNRM